MSMLKTGVSTSPLKKLGLGYLNRTSPMQCLRYLSSSKEETGPNKILTNRSLHENLKERIFNTHLWEHDPEVSFVRRKAIEKKTKKEQTIEIMTKGLPSTRPVTLKLLDEYAEPVSADVNEVTETEDRLPTYPYSENIIGTNNVQAVKMGTDKIPSHHNKLLTKFAERRKGMRQWMSDYDLFSEESQEDHLTSSDINYGSSDPNEPVSNVPCGGCGALLHCQDHSIPGYLPRELFAKRRIQELKSLICQRCHFLKEFNVALDVSVSPDEYPKILSSIQEKRALVILMVDMLDFPCSIWPGIIDIIGTKRPVIIVGNKIDLIPGDQTGYLDHWRETLLIYVQKMGINKSNIKHVSLVSAYTGFGVEDLITQLHELWEYKSDVFLVGCTNVGKSTLFNRLLQSDFCKTQAMNLVQRATTSIWPGTTLNLLKFPVLRPEGWRLAMRRKRLLSQKNKLEMEKKLQKQQFSRKRMYHMPSFMQYVGKTFVQNREEQTDMYSLRRDNKEDLIGIDENDYEFAKSRWCFDTPGVMHPDQILNILTTEELVKVIPKDAIIPRFFILKPGRSLFLAGLGRIDLLSASFDNSVRLAVFSSNHLPVSIVQTQEAEDVYKELLGSELMAVPCGGPKRLAEWPGLQAKEETVEVKGLGWEECCADIILSSAGWVSVSGCEDMSFRVWTPFSRGIHLRQPALVPYSLNFRGSRISHTPTYHTGRAAGKYEKRKKD